MLRTQEVVNFVNNSLNTIGTEDDYSFDIHSNIGENKNNGALNGILYTSQATTIPIPNFVENSYNFVVEILVPSARANYHFDKVQSIVEQFVDTYDGAKVEFENGEGLLNILPGRPENFNVGYNIGENVPLFFSISVLYTESVETSGDVHWLLDGIEIPYLNDDIIVDKEGNVNKIYGKLSTQTFLTGQTKFFRFVFPKKKDTLGRTIQQDLLEGNFNKQYTLTYYDGDVYTAENPFTTKVSIFRSGNKSGQRGKAKRYDITFTEVDDGNTTTKYYIALIDNKFDNQTENTRYFRKDSIEVDGETVNRTAKQVQTDYYETKVLSGCGWEQIKAPNLNSLDITSQVYPNTTGYNLFDLVNKNYAIIKVVGTTTRYYYFFITNASIGQNNQVMFDLRLDTIQTYLFEDDIGFENSYLEKAHLNRWLFNGGYYKFNGNKDSDLFEREDLRNVAKRLVSRTKINQEGFGILVNPDAIDWMNENIVGWVYMYLDPYHKYHTDQIGSTSSGNFFSYFKRFSMKSTSQEDSETYSTELYSTFPCICAPIVREESGRVIMRYTNNGTNYDYIMSKNSLDNFIGGGLSQEEAIRQSALYVISYQATAYNPLLNAKYNTMKVEQNGDAYDLIIEIKRVGDGTANSPYGRFTIGHDSLIEGGGTETAFEGIGISQPVYTGLGDTWYSQGALLLKEIDITNDAYFKTNIKYSFLRSSIVGVNSNPELNPKLLSNDYLSVKIGDENDGFEYDAQKLNTSNLIIKTTEVLVPGVNNKYARVDCYSLPANNVYNEEQTDNLFGYVGQTEYSFSMSTSAYQEMLANNKNFYQQNALNRDMALRSGLLGTASSISSGIASGSAKGGVIGGVIGGVVGGLTSGLQTAFTQEKMLAEEKFAVDNLRNAPSNNQLGSASIFTSCSRGQLGTYVEMWDILPYEKTLVNDFMNKYGFSVNKFGNLKDYLNIRHNHNFVKAEIGNIYGIPMSNTARADMKQRFANGIRFWNSDNISYQQENYENWVNEKDGNGNYYGSFEGWLADQ